MGFFDDGKVKANLVFEMLGRPKEHLEKTMEEFVKQLDSEPKIKIINKKIHEAKLFEQKNQEATKEVQVKQELFTTFVELEVSAEKIFDLAMLVFKYLPSHLEIISPENFDLKNSEFNLILNEMTARLHNYDSIAKTALMHNQMLAKKFLELKEERKNLNKEISVEKQPESSEVVNEDKSAKKSKKKKDKVESV